MLRLWPFLMPFFCRNKNTKVSILYCFTDLYGDYTTQLNVFLANYKVLNKIENEQLSEAAHAPYMK